MRSSSRSGMLAPGWVCMRSIVLRISVGSIDTVTQSWRALWHSTQFFWMI